MLHRVCRVVCAIAALLMLARAQAVVPCTLPVDFGESVATCFSGLLYPLPNSLPYPADPNGYVVGIIDTRLPPLPSNPTPANDVNWATQMFHNQSGPPQHVWNATNLGQVYGLTMDNIASPNIYVAATTLYGSFAFGPGGPGAVYRLDGNTGNICLLFTLPNGGPALGQLAYDPVSHHMFVSNFEDGLVYSVAINPNACSAGNWTTYDHGVQGRTAASLTPIPDAGTNNTFTAKGRRVWGLCVYQGRLYYGVWWEDSGYPQNATENNEIWSVAIDASGNCQASTAIREAILPVLPTEPDSNPVSDIEFTASGKMLAAERTMQADTGGVQIGSNPAHHSRVLAFTGTSGSFTMQPDNTYRTGKFFNGWNSAGGVSSDCDENVWTMVDAIHYGSSTGDTDFVYGLQRILAGGNASDPTPTSNAYIAGLAPGYYKSQLGDVDYRRECLVWEGEPDGQIEGQPEGEGHPEGQKEGEGQREGQTEGQPEGEKRCLTTANGHAECISGPTGTTITYSVDVTNNSGVGAFWALFTSQTPGVTVTPNQVATNIPNGGTQNFTLTFTGAQPGQTICFTITLLDDTRKVCCSETVCFENPCNCVIIPIDKQKIACDPTAAGTYSYTFYITNTSTQTLEHLYLYPDGGGTFTPNYFPLGGLSPGNTAGPFTVTLSGVVPGEYCFTITLHDKELRECCAFRHCIELPNCCDPDTIPPVITITGPTTVQCGQPGIYDATAIDDCDGDVSYTLQAKGQINWFANGTYCVLVTANDTSGNVATTTFCITVTGCPDIAAIIHSADLNGDGMLTLSELLRIIQFYNAGALHVDAFSEDGYAPGASATPETGAHHEADYIIPDWKIELQELLRMIQLYNAQGYHECPDGEDGFCVGKK